LIIYDCMLFDLFVIIEKIRIFVFTLMSFTYMMNLTNDCSNERIEKRNTNNNKKQSIFLSRVSSYL